MAPVILALRNTDWAQVQVLATAQHRKLLDDTRERFDITPDIDLNIMQANQSLGDLASHLLHSIDKVLDMEKPAAVLAQGDTNTVLASAMACFYKKTPFGHVEAGLRSGNMHSPFPEEMNRVLTSRLATLNFAPTKRAIDNLISEGINEESVFLTGNTVIDSLYSIPNEQLHIPINLNIPEKKRLILLTAHRRENFGSPLENIFHAVRDLAEKHSDIHFIYPVHPNPNVVGQAERILKDAPGVTLSGPLDYFQLIAIMKQCWLVMTDSGGLQEEAPALGKPVLVLRDNTERPEAVEAGVARLVGTSYEGITTAVSCLLTNNATYLKMARGLSPYGDGKAASRITAVLQDFILSKES